MPQWGGGEVCPACNKSVYKAEEAPTKVQSRTFHKLCFKCATCNKMLDSTTVAEHELKLFCRNCHGKHYGPKGVGFGGGAGTLSMDSGERFASKKYACKRLLDSTTVAHHDLKLYCKNCYGKFHGPKGVGFGSGAGSLSMDSGERFGGPRNEKKLF
ncbi:cysteine and glycine-rich protein 2-like [Acanthaster planci]|uniref:Cysteine and glycine-rich protein 2-like n=1 Tax=Acanthaster planci TaxID=133434 RepID=A0A8B7ZLP4_ACAPL|nr:cysteine and glycine-rich protein 2-like [Acanthaster planci]